VRRDLGDFQTPPELVAAVLRALGPIGSRWTRVLEPTCGSGAFLRGLLEEANPPREVIGIELQESHRALARSIELAARSTHVEVLRADLFDLDLGTDLPWKERGPLLVVGNPPWVTCSELGRLGSQNHPTKRNVKALRGIEARTGASNFDIAEAVWLKLIDELAPERPTIALLCKTSVARAVLEFAHRRGWPIAEAAIFEFDAVRWFGAAVGACLLRVTLGTESDGPCRRVPVFANLGAGEPRSVIGFFQGRLIAEAGLLERFGFALGTCPLTWRQGLKHDAAPVMELLGDGDLVPFRNRLGESVEIEREFVYPLLKGTDLRRPSRDRPRRGVIVTQRRIGEETLTLEQRAPRLWSYLQRHARRFADRRSSIYRGQPPFALFGVGPYSFAPHKVAISGLHRPPRFEAVGPVAGRPVMFDDTCYQLPCNSAAEAAVLTALCNDPIALEIAHGLSFPDAKRPITKGLLQRIDLSAILDRADRAGLAARAKAALVEHLGMTPDEFPNLADEMDRLERVFES
jgi:hypothetical protein